MNPKCQYVNYMLFAA